MDSFRESEFNFDLWYGYADALATVDALAKDNNFAKLAEQNAISIEYTFSQDNHLVPVCLIDDEAGTNSSLAMFLPNTDRYIALENSELTVREQGGFSFIEGQITANCQKITFSSQGDQWLAQIEDMPALPISPKDVTNLFLAILAGSINERTDDVESILIGHDQGNSDVKKLGGMLSMMGSLIGISSRTIRSYFDGDQGGLITELLEVETPEGSDLHNRLHLRTVNAPLEATDGLIASQHFSSDGEMPNERTAAHYLEEMQEQMATQALRQLALTEDPFMHPSFATIASYEDGNTPSEEVRRYAGLCQQLLYHLDKFIADSK